MAKFFFFFFFFSYRGITFRNSVMNCKYHIYSKQLVKRALVNNVRRRIILRRLIRPQGYNFFFMLNSTEHEICRANKSQITNNCKLFLAKHSWNVSANKYEMPTIVGIFIFISIENFMLCWAEHEKMFYNLGASSTLLPLIQQLLMHHKEAKWTCSTFKIYMVRRWCPNN